MPLLQLRIEALYDGKPVTGFPVNVVQSVDEAQQFDHEKAADNNDTSFSALPVGEVDTVAALLLVAQDAIGQRLEGGEATNVAVRISAGGGFVGWGLSLTDSNLTVNRNAATVARIRGGAFGT
jgi:hypothetical protein